MRKRLRTLYLSIALITLLIGFIACQPTSSVQQTQVRSAHSDWIEELFQTAIINIGLEKLGYQIQPPKQMDYISTYLALSNGDIDYSPVNYKIAHTKYFENVGGEEKLERVGVLIDYTIKGYQIDKKTADEYKITSIEQLEDPKIAQLFDSDGNGKANLVGCNPSWFCETIIDHHLNAYGLENTVEQDKGLYLSLLEDVMDRYQKGESVLYYAYSPHWISAILKPDRDVIWLEVPFTSLPESQKNLTEKDTSVNGKNIGFAVDTQNIVANKTFLAENPVAKRWFEQVQIPVADMNVESLRIHQGEDSLDEIHRHAEEWVEQNQELFDRWLAEARK